MCTEANADYVGTGHGVGGSCAQRPMQTVMKQDKV